MTHSQEPWRRFEEDRELPYAGSSVTGPTCIVDADGNAIVPDGPWIPNGYDIDRIVTCVNFCRFMSNNFLLNNVAGPLRVDEGGAVRVGKSRISLDLVVEQYENGMMPEDIVRAYDTLMLADVYSVIAYYLRHRDEVRAYLTRRAEEAKALRAKIEEEFHADGHGIGGGVGVGVGVGVGNGEADGDGLGAGHGSGEDEAGGLCS